tara:strand:- start:327 stop:536 length:210 start_codon:yes stop_codon:yes gene_type:complete
MVEQMLPPDPQEMFTSEELDEFLYMTSMIEEYEVEMFRLKVKQRIKTMGFQEIEENFLEIYGPNWRENL